MSSWFHTQVNAVTKVHPTRFVFCCLLFVVLVLVLVLVGRYSSTPLSMRAHGCVNRYDTFLVQRQAQQAARHLAQMQEAAFQVRFRLDLFDEKRRAIGSKCIIWYGGRIDRTVRKCIRAARRFVFRVGLCACYSRAASLIVPLPLPFAPIYCVRLYTF